MKLAFFSSKPYEVEAFHKASGQEQFDIHFFEEKLNERTAYIAKGFDAVCVFVNDAVNAKTIDQLNEFGIRCIATRSAGFNQIDIEQAKKYNMAVVRVPAYSPNAISEFTVGLLLTLSRKIHKAYHRVREGNFELAGLQGFELRDKVIGVIGTGKIGAQVVKNLSGFGGKILAYDPFPNEEVKTYAEYKASLEEMYKACDVLSLHLPLTPESHHMINEKAIAIMRPGVVIINTSRGGLIDTKAVIQGLKDKKIGHLAIDVYEEEAALFYQDLSETIINDDLMARLMTFPNVLITGHQAFLTDHALRNIAETTLKNLIDFKAFGKSENNVY
jgi:D-lactate dehydrogenase